MNRSDVEKLQDVRGFPAVSILLSTRHSSPEELQQNPVRVKNLIRAAAERLQQSLSKREAEAVVERLEAASRDVDYAHPKDGLALFANQTLSRAMVLPFAVKERVVINEVFAVRDLVLGMNRSPRYYVLSLCEQQSRLFEGVRGHLHEIKSHGFPVAFETPGVVTEMPSTFGVETSTLHDARDREMFKRVDDAFTAVAGTDHVPLALVGVPRNLAFYREVTRHPERIIATLTGSYTRAAAHQLEKLVWPLVEGAFAARSREVLGDLDSAIGAKRYAFCMDEAWRLAPTGRVQTLLVEENFHYPARIDSNGHLKSADDFMAANTIDAVDEVIDHVLHHKGDVAFVDAGALRDHHHIAMILRY